MTEPTGPGGPGGNDQVEEQDNGAERDPLTTDDGLAEAAEGMPEVVDRVELPGEDAQDVDDRPLLDQPELDIGDDGTDPCAGDEGVE